MRNNQTTQQNERSTIYFRLIPRKQVEEAAWLSAGAARKLSFVLGVSFLVLLCEVDDMDRMEMSEHMDIHNLY